MHKSFSGLGESETQADESSMDFGLDSVNLHSLCSEPEENGFILEPDKELFQIQLHTGVSSDPISSLGDDSLFSAVQHNGGDIIFHSLPEVNIVDPSKSLLVETLEKP